MMRIEKASYQAMKYACLKYHYAKRVPQAVLAYSVFNDDEFCGVVSFGHGANKNIGDEFGLTNGEVVELTRVALNGKQTCTSEVVAMCLKRLHKDCPLVRLVVSYADIDQHHFGTIYQATNWIYAGAKMLDSKDSSYIIHGERVHGRRISQYVRNRGGLHGFSRAEFVRKYYDANAVEYVTAGKRKYLMPLDKKMRKLCETLRQPYPKDENKTTFKEAHPEIYERRRRNEAELNDRLSRTKRAV